MPPLRGSDRRRRCAGVSGKARVRLAPPAASRAAVTQGHSPGAGPWGRLDAGGGACPREKLHKILVRSSKTNCNRETGWLCTAFGERECPVCTQASSAPNEPSSAVVLHMVGCRPP